MKNKHLIGRKVLHIVILLLLLTVSRNINAQPHYFQKYDGIPIIAHTNLTTTELVNRPASLSKMKELGIYGFYAVDLNPQRYNIITNNYDLKVFPYQFHTDTTNIIPYPHITRYTNAVYSIWLAGGRGNGELGDIQIDYNPDLADRTIDGTGIETKNNGVPGHLLDGPYYFQWREYKVYGGTVRYNADFRMKIDSIDTLPAGYRDDLVCSLQVVASRFVEDIPGDPLIQYDTTLHYKLVYVRDFENPSTGSLWGNWTKQSIERYTLMAVNQSREDFYGEDVEATGSDFTASFMQYKVYWTGLQYLKLTIDTINIYDNVGWELFNSQIAINRITESLNYYNDTNYVLGWHGIGEPFSIDNYLPFREMNYLVKEVNPQLRVFFVTKSQKKTLNPH